LVSRPDRWVQAGIQCPTVGTVTGVKHPAPRLNGTADRVRRVGARIVVLVGGVPIQGGRPTGAGGRPAGASIILSQIGEVRPAAGVIHSQPELSPSGSGFTPLSTPSQFCHETRNTSRALGFRKRPSRNTVRWARR